MPGSASRWVSSVTNMMSAVIHGDHICKVVPACLMYMIASVSGIVVYGSGPLRWLWLLPSVGAVRHLTVSRTTIWRSLHVLIDLVVLTPSLGTLCATLP